METPILNLLTDKPYTINMIYIEHIALNVRDLEGAKLFFCKYFGGMANEGYHNPKTGLHSYFITFGQGPRLEIMNWGDDMPHGNKDRHADGYQHISMSVGSREKVDEMTALLVADGYSCVNGPRYTGDGAYESVVLLPGGEEIELTV